VQNIENEVKRVQTELESLKKELETLRASPEFSQVQAMAQKAADAETQVEQFHSQLIDLFSHVSRAFTKYSYGLTKETEARLQMMSGEPWKMFEEADISPYVILLQDIRKSIDSGKIQLKDFDKVLQYLDVIISSLPELQDKALALKVQADSLRQGNGNLVSMVSELEDKIMQHEEEVAKGMQEAEQQRRQIAEKSGELASHLKEASSILEELAGQKYVLEY
jgi:cell division septum initiation protein DivIVA